MKKTRVLVLFDTDAEPPVQQEWKKQLESSDEAEFDVARALTERGHQVRLFGFRDNLDQLAAGLRAEPVRRRVQSRRALPRSVGARLLGGGAARDARHAVHRRVVRGADARARQGADQEGARVPGAAHPALHGVPPGQRSAPAQRPALPADREAARRGRVGRHLAGVGGARRRRAQGARLRSSTSGSRPTRSSRSSSPAASSTSA